MHSRCSSRSSSPDAVSDHVGRRPVGVARRNGSSGDHDDRRRIADGLTNLLVARVLQRSSAGAAVAAVGAGLLEHRSFSRHHRQLDRRAAGTAAWWPPRGHFQCSTSAGPRLISSIWHSARCSSFKASAYFMNETLTAAAWRAGITQAADQRPRACAEGVHPCPSGAHRPRAFAGFYAALAPSLVRTVLDSAPPRPRASCSLPWREAPASRCWYSAITKRRRSRCTAQWRCSSACRSPSRHSRRPPRPPFYFGAVVAGIGFGARFQGAVRSVISLAKPDERAGVLSVIFVVSYIAMGLPAIIAGLFIGTHGDLRFTTEQFAAVVMVLAGLALLAALRKTAVHHVAKPAQNS